MLAECPHDHLPHNVAAIRKNEELCSSVLDAGHEFPVQCTFPLPRDLLLFGSCKLNSVCFVHQLFWFAAFIALSVYTNKGISAGESKEKDEKLRKEGGCAVFQAGTGEARKACEMNKSAVGLAVIMWYA